MNADAITDAERYPTLTEDGRRMLEFLREHPHAPIFRNESGNRLTADEVALVRGFEREARLAEVGWRPGERPLTRAVTSLVVLHGDPLPEALAG